MKIQLTIAIDFISSRDYNDEECVMHSKNDNIEIMISGEADKVIEEIFDSFKNRYQNNQWEVVSLSLIMFIYCYKCHRINFNPGR